MNQYDSEIHVTMPHTFRGSHGHSSPVWMIAEAKAMTDAPTVVRSDNLLPETMFLSVLDQKTRLTPRFFSNKQDAWQ